MARIWPAQPGRHPLPSFPTSGSTRPLPAQSLPVAVPAARAPRDVPGIDHHAFDALLCVRLLLLGRTR